MKRWGIVALLVLLALAIGCVVLLLIRQPVGQEAPAKSEITAQAQYADSSESLRYVRCFYASGELQATGSGFVIAEDGLMLTAAHVVEGAFRVTVIDSSGKEQECTVIHCDESTDVALLALPKGNYPALQLAARSPKSGEVVRAMGYPSKETLVITEGLVSAAVGTVQDRERMLVTCEIVNGMSGGPLFNEFGEVIGMASGSVRTMDGIHLSVLWSDLEAVVSEVRSGKEEQE